MVNRSILIGSLSSLNFAIQTAKMDGNKKQFSRLIVERAFHR